MIKFLIVLAVLYVAYDYVIYGGAEYLATEQKMILCYHAGSKWGYPKYNCKLVPRGKGY